MTPRRFAYAAGHAVAFVVLSPLTLLRLVLAPVARAYLRLFRHPRTARAGHRHAVHAGIALVLAVPVGFVRGAAGFWQLPLLAPVVVAYGTVELAHYFRGCPRDVLRFPVDPDAAVEKQRRVLAIAHRTRGASTLGYLAVVVPADVLLSFVTGPWAASPVLLVAWLVGLDVCDRRHQALTLWCPRCRGRGPDDDVAVPDPDPAPAMSR